jgi:hypothetical protein
MQPFYHTGLRVSYAASDTVTINGIIVNGTNNPTDFDVTPHFGGQVGLTLGDAFLAAGYYTGPSGSGFNPVNTGENDDWEHFFDVVLTASIDKLTFVGNVDFYVLPEIPENGTDLQFYWGASAAVGYQIVDTFGIAVRGEFLHNREQFFATGYEQLVTGTLTLDYRPVENLIIRLDNRFEWADQDVFSTNDGAGATWFASTLGVVVTAN